MESRGEPYFHLRFASSPNDEIEPVKSQSNSEPDDSGMRPRTTYRTERLKSSRLGEEMKKMVNDPDCSDVTFVCRDGVKVHASRMMLVAKCSVFRTMLGNGMAESRQSEISLPAIASTGLLAVLEFLYTGELSRGDLHSRFVEAGAGSCPLKSWIGLLQVKEAASFFMLRDLEESLLRMLWDETVRRGPSEDDMLQAIASRLTLVLELFENITVADIDSNASGMDMEFIAFHLVRILYSHDLTLAVLSNLSPRAFSYFFTCTQRVKPKKKEKSPVEQEGSGQGSFTCVHEDFPDGFLFMEYLRLRQLINWCWLKEIKAGVRALLNSICNFLPEPLKAKSYLEKPSRLSLETPTALQAWPTLIPDTVKTRSLDLSMVDLTLIHPELLVNIVEPLNLVSTSEIMEVLRTHMLHGSLGSLRLHRTCSCSDAETVRPSGKWRILIGSADTPSIEKDGDSLVTEAGGQTVRAYWSGAMWFYDDYEWKIELHSSQRLETWEVGFTDYLYGEHLFGVKSSSWRGRKWSAREWGLCLKENKVSSFERINYETSLGEGLGAIQKKTTTKVRVRLNRREKTCSFLIEGKECCRDWPNLSSTSGTMYPAVYLPDTPCDVTITMKVIKGFAFTGQELTCGVFHHVNPS